MTKHRINSFEDFLNHLEEIELLGYEINLFRGQSSNKPLLPSICRENPNVNTTEIEVTMLEDFKRRSPLLITRNFDTKWEWLVYAQHFGLKTRLLDWTSNPLIALWFACQNQYTMNNSSYLYILSCNNDMQVDLSKNPSPFEIKGTKILKPTLNNERIIAQFGWFTAHPYSGTTNKFVTLEKNTRVQRSLREIEIPKELKKDLLRRLSMFGVNNRTVFPDIQGLSLHLNWKYLADKYNL